MTEFASHETAYAVVEEEPPELAASNQISGAHLWASATAFFFIGFLFAFFYLRSLNNGGMWRPKGVHPSVALGTASMACMVACAVAVTLGLRDQRAGRRAEWRLKGAAALALGLAAIGLQVAE